MHLIGDSTPLSPWVLDDNACLVFLRIAFSFFLTIYLMSLFIGLLTNAISEANNNESFLILKAEVSNFITNFIAYQIT